MDESSTDRAVDVLTSHEAQVGSLTVRRALPQRRRRTVGAWCFADHMGPADVTEGSGLDIGPHPHTGLQTVTWLIDGEALHRDSLGSEQVISAGQLNLMTAGYGVSHAEEATGHYRGTLQGIQLWIAQSDATRDGSPGFEHHAELPRLEIGEASATVLIGDFNGARSPATRLSRLSWWAPTSGSMARVAWRWTRPTNTASSCLKASSSSTVANSDPGRWATWRPAATK